MVYNLAFRILGDPDLAVAAAEHTFQQARLAFPHCLKAPQLWLARVAVACCQEQLFRVQHPAPASYHEVNGSAQQAAQPGHSGQASRDGYQDSLDRVPPRQRVALVLSDVLGLSYREISSVTGFPVSTVCLLLSLGRSNLRDTLRERGYLLSPESPDGPPPGGTILSFYRSENRRPSHLGLPSAPGVDKARCAGLEARLLGPRSWSALLEAMQVLWPLATAMLVREARRMDKRYWKTS